MNASTLLWNTRADARYVRFSVRWTQNAIAAIEIAVVRDRPLPTQSLPLELPRWSDVWF